MTFWIHKPEGITSAQVVNQIKFALTRNGYFQRGFKIGHGGTLDPFATGVLIVLIGEATKLADAYLHSIKTYSGKITLGKKTDTADRTGTVVETQPIPTLSLHDWQKLANGFCAEPYYQVPPMYSSKKRDGKPLYEMARAGITVERQAILKKVFEFEVLAHSADQIEFQAKVESGTYIRTLAEDLAAKAGTLANLETLCRTQTSDARIDQCVALDALVPWLDQKIPLQQLPGFQPLHQVASHLPSFALHDQTAMFGIRNGQRVILQPLLEKIQNQFGGKSSFVIAKWNDQPVALFSTIPGSNEPFRLQRILLPENP